MPVSAAADEDAAQGCPRGQSHPVLEGLVEAQERIELARGRPQAVLREWADVIRKLLDAADAFRRILVGEMQMQLPVSVGGEGSDHRVPARLCGVHLERRDPPVMKDRDLVREVAVLSVEPNECLGESGSGAAGHLRGVSIKEDRSLYVESVHHEVEVASRGEREERSCRCR